MDLRVTHDAFRTRELSVRFPSFWKGSRLLLDGREVSSKRRQYVITDDMGQERTLRLKHVFLDPVPSLQVDAEPPIALAPPLRWYEWAWIGIPMLLLVAGGAIGGFLGMLAMGTSARIFRSERSPLSKYVLSGLLTTTAFIVFAIAAAIIRSR